jgi:hypothetical protein
LERDPDRLRPTGNFEPNWLSLTGLNRPALDLKGAYTYLGLQTGLELTGALGVKLNAPNTTTNYQSGAELHFEWAVNQHFPLGLAAGVGGYFYQQVTNDHGSGDQLGAFRGRVAAVWPSRSYALKAGAQEIDFSVRWFQEFAVQNRVRADLIDLRVLQFPALAQTHDLRAGHLGAGLGFRPK